MPRAFFVWCCCCGAQGVWVRAASTTACARSVLPSGEPLCGLLARLRRRKLFTCLPCVLSCALAQCSGDDVPAHPDAQRVRHLDRAKGYAKFGCCSAAPCAVCSCECSCLLARPVCYAGTILMDIADSRIDITQSRLLTLQVSVQCPFNCPLSPFMVAWLRLLTWVRVLCVLCL